MNNPLNQQLDVTSRRGFITSVAGTCLGVGLLPHLPQSASAAVKGGKAKRVIYLYMSGGMSHIDTFDPKPGSDTQGPTKVIKSKADGIQLGEHLPNCAKHTDKMTLIRSLTSTQGAHERGNYFMHTSYAPIATIRHPSMAAWVSNYAGRINQTLPAGVLVGVGSRHPGVGYMESKHMPLRIGDPAKGLPYASLPKNVSESDFKRRRKLADSFDRQFRNRYPHKDVKAYTDFYDDAVNLMKSEDLAAFDLSKENKQVRARYGKSRFGQGCLLARRLIERDVRFVEVELGGWDTHNDNYERVSEKCADLDAGLSSLLADLKAKGLLDSTLVVLATEFGRSPKINTRDGRDHHPKVFSCMLAGGGVKGGYVYGQSDKKGHGVDDKAVRIPDFNATIATAMGMPIKKVYQSKTGRPFTLADKGQPVMDVFS